MAIDHSRRNFITKFAGGLGSLWAASALLPGLLSGCSGCNKKDDPKNADQGADSFKPCPTETLDETSQKARATLKYVEKSPISTRTCANCKLYKQPIDNAHCGGCTLFSGFVNPAGHCGSWLARM